MYECQTYLRIKQFLWFNFFYFNHQYFDSIFALIIIVIGDTYFAMIKIDAIPIFFDFGTIDGYLLE